MNLTLEERETIIVFNEKEDLARVNTFNARLKKRIEQINERADEKIEITDRGYGEVEFYVPKKMITLYKAAKSHMSEEEREKKRALMRALRERKANE